MYDMAGQGEATRPNRHPPRHWYKQGVESFLELLHHAGHEHGAAAAVTLTATAGGTGGHGVSASAAAATTRCIHNHLLKDDLVQALNLGRGEGQPRRVAAIGITATNTAPIVGQAGPMLHPGRLKAGARGAVVVVVVRPAGLHLAPLHAGLHGTGLVLPMLPQPLLLPLLLLLLLLLQDLGHAFLVEDGAGEGGLVGQQRALPLPLACQLSPHDQGGLLRRLQGDALNRKVEERGAVSGDGVGEEGPAAAAATTAERWRRGVGEAAEPRATAAAATGRCPAALLALEGWFGCSRGEDGATPTTLSGSLGPPPRAHWVQSRRVAAAC